MRTTNARFNHLLNSDWMIFKLIIFVLFKIVDEESDDFADDLLEIGVGPPLHFLNDLLYF